MPQTKTLARLIWQNETTDRIRQWLLRRRSCSGAPCGNMKIMNAMMMRAREKERAIQRERANSYQIYDLDSLLKCHRALMQWNEALGLGLNTRAAFYLSVALHKRILIFFSYTVFFFFSQKFLIFLWCTFPLPVESYSCPLFALSWSEWLGFFLAATEIYAFLRLCKPWFFLLAAT